ncbi:hypothetical protein F400_gp095 [Bacillus phage BCD7]|uniref:Uncharacterized protein n=1 Tax=Bacillus phage BCD7 TaxID=1136534 RepID=J9PUD9_9CAUD|nr:hypothetical protein F400_gp095 [Bacillus phage BCD7]AEZ50542.1 hypothetical protein BCD7_0095 [Bacillus phage BCD7]
MTEIIPGVKKEFILTEEELDLAFMQKLTGLIINGEEVPVHYFNPDLDVEEKVLPKIVFFRDTPFPDYSRLLTDDVEDNHVFDAEGKLIAVDRRQAPEPWSVMYNIRLYYEFQQDGVKILQHIRRRLPLRRAELLVKGQLYPVEYQGARVWGAQYKDFGETKEGKREFNDSLIYKVDFQLDVYDRVTHSITHDIILNEGKFKEGI